MLLLIEFQEIDKRPVSQKKKKDGQISREKNYKWLLNIWKVA